ncbi:MAG: flagellar biosynthesis anti-sigma factor FlgM [Bryobacteraceae bacterium]
MKIDQTTLGGISGPASHETQKAEQTKQALSRYGRVGPGDSGNGSSDRVELSTLGQQLREIASGGPEQERKVEELRAQVEAGTYRVDSSVVGSKLVDEALSDSSADSSAKGAR